MNREVYDLCRKYKHYYNKHKDVTDWSRKYHDLNFDDMLSMTKSQLNEVERELLVKLLDEYDFNVVSAEVNVSNSRMRRECSLELMDCGKFINVLQEYLWKYRRVHIGANCL